MLTSYADDEAVNAAIMAGASGYVLKQVRGDELVDGSDDRTRRVPPRPRRHDQDPRADPPQ